MEKYVDETWVVDASLPVRIDRVIRRDGLTETEIMDRIRRQMSSEDKRSRADYILENSGTLEELHSQIDQLLERIDYER